MTNFKKKIIERYSNRYNKLGYDVKTLGWGSEGQQSYRFDQSINGVLFRNESVILDIGCGFGDFLNFLKIKNKPFSKYIGWDLNPDLINEANNLWDKNDEKEVVFEVQDIQSIEIKKTPVANIGFMHGVLNLKLDDGIDNWEYTKELITKAFQCVDELLVIDFISSEIVENYPVEDFINYNSPTKLLSFVFSDLTKKVKLDHSYDAIPQREFTLYLFK